MASFLTVLLSLALIAVTVAAPVEQTDSTTAAPTDEEAVPVVEYLEVIETVPVVELIAVPTTKPTTKPDHKLVKRSALRGDNPSNDLLADLEGLKIESGLSSLDGRRIKFLPTWLG